MSIAIPFIGSVQYEPYGEMFPSFKQFGRHIKDHFVPHHRNNYHPHMLGHRAVALFSLLLVTVKIGGLVLLSLGPVSPAFSSAITPENIISLTNESRIEYGIGTVTQNSQLRAAAQAKADDMLANQYFAHNSPDGRTPWDFIKAAGYKYVIAGENLAVDFVQAENVEDAWMNSPGHRANILNENFEEIGIGIAQGQFEGHSSIFVVQMFGASSDQPIQTLATPTQVEPAVEAPPQPAPTTVAQAPAAQPTAQPVAQAEVQAGPAEVVPVATPEQENSALIAGTEIPTLVSVYGSNVEILAWAPNASRVIVQYGQKAIMLDPVSDYSWKGTIPLSELASENNSMMIEAYGLDGKLGSVRLASFSSSLVGNYSTAPEVAGATISVLGRTLDVKQFESKFYLVFVSLVLVSLIVAIAVHRHIQHVNLVANGSFVAIFATLLWYFG
ncbi:MAG: hypothetical protein IT410_00510 [Candidatus Doudnabacteria bacterium]|nr:hypothetical protein [Candidatus Doudnabacteria bacterium]